jgi:hypothetical protein
MPYSYDFSAGRYRTADGRFVRDAAIRSAFDTVITAQAATMRELTQLLLDGRLPLAAWQASMMQSIKSVHLIGTATAVGGWNQLDQSDFGWVGQRIRSQYSFLRGFAADIAAGRQKLDETLLARSELYAEAGRQTHRAAVGRAAKERDMMLERNQLGAADHCPGCLRETARGWVGIGTLVPCGSRNCLARCHCVIQYKASQAA